MKILLYTKGKDSLVFIPKTVLMLLMAGLLAHFNTCFPSHSNEQWCIKQAFNKAYSCGNSSGFSPNSLLIE
jgi:hypothetical protein